MAIKLSYEFLALISVACNYASPKVLKAKAS